MTLILIDGCDDNGSSGSATAGTTALGRNGKGVSAYTYPIPVAQQSDTVTIGFAYRTGLSSAVQILAFAGAGSLDVSLNLLTTGEIQLRAFTTVLRTSPANTIVANVWYYLEWQFRVHNTLGTSTVRINGTVVPSLTATGLDTQAFSGNIVGTLSTIATRTPAPLGIDDLYLMTGTGDSFLGDCVVETLYPNGNGAANAWVGSDGNSTDNYLLVDETPLATTDYTGSPTSGAQDMYTFGDLAGTGAVLAVCHAAVAQKTDSGAKQFKLVNRGSTDTKSAALDPTTTFTGYHYVLTTNPETGSPWTSTQVNALQGGVEVA